jgi:hypothetical protein
MLQKTAVGIFLDINQVGDFDYVLYLGKVFTQEVIIGDRISHGFSFGGYRNWNQLFVAKLLEHKEVRADARCPNNTSQGRSGRPWLS